jgi:hypothetical protein
MVAGPRNHGCLEAKPLSALLIVVTIRALALTNLGSKPLLVPVPDFLRLVLPRVPIPWKHACRHPPSCRMLKPTPGIRPLSHGLHSPFAHLVVRIGCPALCRAEDSLVCRHLSRVLLRPRGPRSDPGSSVPVHQRLSAPSYLLAGTSRFRRLCNLYAMPSLCGST